MLFLLQVLKSPAKKHRKIRLKQSLKMMYAIWPADNTCIYEITVGFCFCCFCCFLILINSYYDIQCNKCKYDGWRFWFLHSKKYGYSVSKRKSDTNPSFLTALPPASCLTMKSVVMFNLADQQLRILLDSCRPAAVKAENRNLRDHKASCSKKVMPLLP